MHGVKGVSNDHQWSPRVAALHVVPSALSHLGGNPQLFEHTTAVFYSTYSGCHYT